MNPFKAVIFDCDGVLIDSEVIYLKSLKKYLNSINVEVDIEDLVFVVGMKSREISMALKSRFNIETISVDEIEIMQDKYLKNAMDKMKLEPMDQLIPFLKHLKSEEIKIAVASSSVRSYVEDVLNRIGVQGYIDLIVCGDDVRHSKPHPEIFIKTVDMLGLKKEDCIVIEDSTNGILAAKKAGIFVIAFKGSDIIQNTKDANLEIKDFFEILEYEGEINDLDRRNFWY